MPESVVGISGLSTTLIPRSVSSDNSPTLPHVEQLGNASSHVKHSFFSVRNGLKH